MGAAPEIAREANGRLPPPAASADNGSNRNITSALESLRNADGSSKLLLHCTSALACRLMEEKEERTLSPRKKRSILDNMKICRCDDPMIVMIEILNTDLM